MTNLFRKKSKGAATLILTVMLLFAATLIVLFGASYSLMHQKIISNQMRNQEAYQAAEAGLEFGIIYLQQNKDAILASPIGGFIPAYTNASTTNVTLANNSKYSIVYSNPIANNYIIILVTSTGVSGDSTATRVVSQQVAFGSLLTSGSTTAVVAKGDVNMSGNASIVNTESSKTLESSSGVSISGSSNTITSGGVSSTAGNIRSDVVSNIAALSAMTASDYFASYFGASSSIIQASVANYYSSSTANNYSNVLNGKTGTSIWINQTGGAAQINGNTIIGSAANPVLLIVNGSLQISGNVTIYGFVYVQGPYSAQTDISGNVSIEGALANGDNFVMSGNADVTYNSAILEKVKNATPSSYFAKVPGSWKDF